MTREHCDHRTHSESGDGLIRRRRTLRLTGVVLIMVLAWLILVFQLFIHPRLDPVRRADAIVVLGEPDRPALERAHQLLDQHIADQLVLIIPFGPPPDCSTPPPDVTVYCVVPDPLTTRGDARAIKPLADRHGWKRLLVVTWTSHISRSRMLIDRCYQGSVMMTDYQQDLRLTGWLGQSFYQSAAYVKAWTERGC